MRKSIFCVVLLLAACAKPPGKIEATAVPAGHYMQMSCVSLASEKAGKQAQLNRFSNEQQDTSDRDAAWMTIIHLPVASMSNGDREPEIAHLKGQLNAINQASRAKSCN